MEGVEALYHAYRDDVFRLALSYTGQIADAEDISQTVFLKLMDHYSRLTPGKEKNWLLKVAAKKHAPAAASSGSGDNSGDPVCGASGLLAF